VEVVLLGTGVEPIPPTGYGGVERSIAEYASALRRAGVAVRVIQTVRRRRPIDEYWFALELGKLHFRPKEEILHASTPVVANRLSQLQLPYIYTSHSRHWFLRDGLTDRLGAFLERRAVARSATTVALTDRLAGEIAQQVPRRRHRDIPVIPLGVDTDRFRPGGSEGNPQIALGVGAVIPAKRWEVAGSALRSTRISLRLAGPTPDREYARRVAQSGPVQLLGEVSEDQLIHEYQNAGMLLHPSRVEILPGAVLQALACGLPVLGGAALGGVVRDGIEGRILPGPDVGDAEVVSYREAALSLSEDPATRRRWRQAAIDHIHHDFTWDSVVQRHLTLYEQVLRDPAA